jgi:6-phosphofructokinase
VASHRIGILTGGGDVPGLNSVIKSVTFRASELGYEVIGIRRGWQGLTHMRPGRELDPEYALPLNRLNTRTIDRTGGTWLHTSRTNPRKMRESMLPPTLAPERTRTLQVSESVYDLTPVVLENIERLGLDYLIPIGGDDTQSFSHALITAGIPVIGIPKTMDNDVRGTEYCIGFATAVDRAKELINRQRTTLGSHERVGVFRIFGRDAGFTALMTAYVTSSRCLIPEATYDLDHLCQLLAEDKRNNPSRYAIVITAEGAIWEGGQLAEYGDADSFGHRHKVNVAEALADEIKKRTGEEAVASELTYDLRSGDPDALDTIVGITFANIAMDLVEEGRTGRMAAVVDGKYTHSELPDPAAGPRTVDVATMYNTERLRPIYSDRGGRPMLLVTAS